eukprot:2400427-Pyramimonas_sp.AAC.1
MGAFRDVSFSCNHSSAFKRVSRQEMLPTTMVTERVSALGSPADCAQTGVCCVLSCVTASLI